MPPKRRATRSSTVPSGGVKRAKTTAGANDNKTTAVPDDKLTHEHNIVVSQEPEGEPPQPASPKKSSTSSPKKPVVPSFTSFNIPGKPKPIPCQRSVHASASHGPTPSPSPDLIFTHGAGGDLTAPAMIHFSYGFASTGSSIFMFQGNMNLAARAKGFESVLAYERSSKSKEANREDGESASEGVAFGGRSMGSRAAVVASQTAGQDGKLLVLASYPLVGPKGDLRDTILLALPTDTSVLFLSGDHDNMCPLAQLEKVRAKMKAKTWLVTVVGADHGMNVRGGKALKKGTEEMGKECGRIAARWLQERDDGVREMQVRWDGERERILGTWGNEKGEANSEGAHGGGIKRFFSKLEEDAKDKEPSAGDGQGRKSIKTKK